MRRSFVTRANCVLLGHVSRLLSVSRRLASIAATRTRHDNDDVARTFGSSFVTGHTCRQM